ncbi:hypothetical protein FOA52_009892 [Chlamydomonas sp. UWO 241]|nr:hypothetical protein FOA52_009892 [Chlamydomonas sp. UWO 241]
MEEADLQCDSADRVTDEKGRADDNAGAAMGAKLVEAAEGGDADASRRLLDDDQPVAVREECVRLLLLHGTRFDLGIPVMVRVGRELASWAWRFAGTS